MQCDLSSVQIEIIYKYIGNEKSCVEYHIFVKSRNIGLVCYSSKTDGKPESLNLHFYFLTGTSINFLSTISHVKGLCDYVGWYQMHAVCRVQLATTTKVIS